MADVEQRFFCHQCSLEIPRVAADFTCPTCNSGFIEELGQDAAAPAPPRPEAPFPANDQFDQLGQVLGPLESLLPGLLGQGVGPVGSLSSRPMGPRAGGLRPRIRIARGGSRPQHLGMDQAALENALQDFIVNLAGMEFGAGAHPGLQGGGAPGGPQFHFVNPGGGGGLGVQLHGNPGDYAWGRGGLDAIITQLLNHMDGTGPPPMAKENIADIPTVKMTKEMLEKNSSCSVCWEDFTDGEEVKKLECDHCFHSGCIVPWLELHGTCPVCRKELGRSTASGSQRASTPDPAPPHLDEASGGAAAPPPPADAEGAGNNTQRRASVTVSGSGGLTGLIQSALNQVFASPWASSSPGSSSSSRSESRSPTDSNNQTSTSQPSSSRSQAGSSSSSNSGQGSTSQPQTRSSPESHEDEGTPATRRPRLDSEFVDLDFD